MLIFLNDRFKYMYLGAATVLVLGLGSCEQQQAKPVSPTPLPQMQAARYYLNVKPSTKEVIEQLDPGTMTRVDVLDGQQAATYAHDPEVKKVVAVRTK